MAGEEKKNTDEGSEFADFMADISEEISLRVESLDAALPTPVEPLKRVAPVAMPSEAGMILEWDSVVDRIIEEML